MSISIGMLEHHDNADKKDCIGWSALQHASHANRMRRILMLLVVADASLATLAIASDATTSTSGRSRKSSLPDHYQLNSDFRDR